MKKEAGLWIDHRKAVIVTLEEKAEVIREISSNMEKHVRFSSGTQSNSPNSTQGSTAEDVRDRQYGVHLGKFYDEVIAMVREADSILIFGPGEAKVELETRLKHEHLEERIVGIETVDKMTDHQIAAKVREHYARQ
ncbi:MAG TPA: hypothetical protein VFF78_00750 [Anaerolineaceae bacterium]|nr:hypothetical protein [Anaerolineaceae bacterium]